MQTNADGLDTTLRNAWRDLKQLSIDLQCPYSMLLSGTSPQAAAVSVAMDSVAVEKALGNLAERKAAVLRPVVIACLPVLLTKIDALKATVAGQITTMKTSFKNVEIQCSVTGELNALRNQLTDLQNRAAAADFGQLIDIANVILL
jgi:hypothetical protein